MQTMILFGNNATECHQTQGNKRNMAEQPANANMPEQKEKYKETQLERVFEFITERGEVATWELEDWARRWGKTNAGRMMGGSATRHARTLCKLGRIIHPTENGIKNKHYYKLP